MHKPDEKIAARIEKQIDSYENKIKALSGDYLTNTWKRQREKETREKKKDNYREHISVLQKLANINQNTELSKFEKALLVSTNRDLMKSYTVRDEIKYPNPDECMYDHMKEWTQKECNSLFKMGITNLSELEACVHIYKTMIDGSVSEEEQNARELKKMIDEARLRQKGDINFTPQSVAQELVKLSHIQSGDKVAELSAGIGNIADEIRSVTDYVDCVEPVSHFRDILEMKGHSLIGHDAFDIQGKEYDAVIINPPFSNNQDIEHVKHAYNLTKDGGTVVSITSPHWTFANDKKSKEFREWIDDKNYHIQELESGTFEATGIKSNIVVIYK